MHNTRALLVSAALFAVASVDSDLADVEGEFRQRGKTVKEKMRLVLEDGAWKIQDM